MKKFSLHSNYRLELQENSDKHFIDNAEWAEWDHRGRLVFTKEGKLFISDINESGEHFPIQIADFNDDEPTSISPPEWAMKW
jgi:hypothetical protein